MEMSPWSVVIIGLISGCVLYFFYWFINILIFRCKVNKFPGRKANFFLGDLVSLPKERDKLFESLRKMAVDFPDGCRVWGGFFAAYHFQKAKDYELILSNSKYIFKESFYEFLRPWLGDGLLISSGSKWHERRKILTPAFHFNVLKKFVKVFGEHCEKFVDDLKIECSKEKTNIMPLASHLTLELICETAMGVQMDRNNEKQKEYINAIKEMGELLVERTITLHYYFDIIYKLSASGRKFFKLVDVTHQFTKTVIQERERTFKDGDFETLENDNEDDAVYKRKKFAMLDLLISAKRNNGEIDDVGIREEVETFMFEGHDTTAMAISFTIFCLANNKNAQERARQEVDDILQDSTRTANYQDLQNMSYLEMVIKETLRLYPSVPLIIRTLEEDVSFRNGKYTMPNTSQVHMYIFDLHRDPTVFENPLKFDPDRFLPENVKNRHPYAYVPFSAGPRNCIGQRFAMLEVKSIVSSVLRNFQIDPIDTPQSITLQSDLVLRPVNGLYVKFRPRN